MIRKSSDILKQYYTGDYVAQYANQPAARINRLVSFFCLKSTDIVVDYACGDGLLSRIIADKVQMYYGVDFSEEFIDVANNSRKVDNALFFCSDIILFALEHENTFDKAFTLDFSEHIYDDDFVNIYSAILKSLKKGGSLFIHTPNSKFILEVLKSKGLIKQNEEHVGVRSLDEYCNLLKQAGFTTLIHHFLPHYFLLPKLVHPLSFLPVIGKYFQARIFIQCIK